MKNTLLRILFLEDDPEDFEIIQYVLETSEFSIIPHRVDTKLKFLEALETFNPDMILSDHSLPQFDSTEALKILRARDLSIPFILVTGAMSDEFAVKSLKLGADDYVLKSNLAKLPNIIKNTLKQKEAERERVQASKELARRNEELLKINRELDSFVYSVSHNLRAPLMSVLGLLNLARLEKDPGSLNQYHSMMEDSIHTLDDTLREILEYSRNARQGLKLEEVDIKKVIDENFQKMRFMPGVERIEKQVNIDQHAPFYSDAYRLSVIFNNLISNAIKYADKNKSDPFIRITVDIDADRAVLECRDNGMGIEEHLAPKVFEMFFRATDANDGAGLGLYIVKEAINMLQGSISVQSKVGEGCVFTIEVPNKSCDAIPVEAPVKNTHVG